MTLTQECWPAALTERLTACRVVAVLILEDPADAPALGRALWAGGIRAVELTLRTPAALDALRAMRDACPELLVGAGTVLSPDQVEAVCDAGAAFAVAPGLNPAVVRASIAAGLPFAPGICTPSDIETALSLGCRVLKYFPAETMGGLKHLESMAAPYAHLGLRFIPLGGLNEQNMLDYLGSPLIAAIGGSWIAPRDRVQARDWPAITDRARRAATRMA